MGSAYKQKRSWSKRKERRRNRKKDVDDNTVVGEEERSKRIWLNQKSFNKYKNLLFHYCHNVITMSSQCHYKIVIMQKILCDHRNYIEIFLINHPCFSKQTSIIIHYILTKKKKKIKY